MYKGLLIISPHSSRATRIVVKSARNLDYWAYQEHYPELVIHSIGGFFATYRNLKDGMKFLTKKKGINPKDILVVYFGHGEKDILYGDELFYKITGRPMLSLNQDLSFLKDTTFVSVACLSGKKLGKGLVHHHGVRRFFGFDEEILVNSQTSRTRPAFEAHVGKTEDAVDIYTYIPKALLNGRIAVKNSYISYLKNNYSSNELAKVARESIVEY